LVLLENTSPNMYPTDLTDSQWEVIQHFLPVQRKRKYSLRLVVNATLYILKTGCQWRMLPKEYPPYQVVYYYFRSWALTGKWEELNRQLNRLYRLKHGRKSSPSVAIVDSQTVKNSERGLSDTGFDGHKRIKGRKRHLAVDTLGLVLAVSLTAANVHDSKAAFGLFANLARQEYERLERVLADSAYRGSLQNWSYGQLGWKVEIATAVKGNQKAFEISPQRWKVERTISWLQWSRRLAKDYEANLDSAAAFVYLNNINRIRINI
jgi:putative transposase